MKHLQNTLSTWFRRMTYRQKFTIIAAVFLLPMLAFLPLATNEISRIKRYGSDELFGTLYIRPLWKLANDLHLHQVVSQQSANRNAASRILDDVQAVIDADFVNLEQVQNNEIQSAAYQGETSDFKTQWSSIKEAVHNGDLPGAIAMHEELYERILSLISRVADNSHLVLDPELDTYYLANTMLVLMTESQKTTLEINQAANAGTADSELSPAEKEQLARLANTIESTMEQVDGNIRIALANNSRVDMDQMISAPLATYKSEMRSYLDFITSEVLNPDSTAKPAEITEEQNRIHYQKINAANQAMYTAASEALQAGISARVNSLILRFIPTVLIVLASLVGAFVLGQNLMDSISQPLMGLALASQQLASGDLSTRVDVKGSVELVKLADALNRMADDLQADQSNLVARASDLETANRIIENRAQNLQSISEISRIISSEQRLEILLSLITRLVSEKFNFYHAGIFLMDDNRLFALLHAANSDGGQRMLNRGHRLELGTGIVGTVALTGKPRIALDVGADAVFFDNPDLPATRSEMALPLKVRGETIGVLDVQSTRAGEFTDDDANLLGILADQIAIAIDNARLFAKNQQTLEEVQALYNQYLQKEWKTLHAKTQSVGYWQTLSGGRSIEAPIETEDIRQAVRSGQTLIAKVNGDDGDPAVVVPIKLRAQTIGVLSIKGAARQREWSKDELNLIQSVTDRLALALENARLFEETSRRAERERLVSEITGRIRSVNDPQAMIETAVEELRNALGASRVQIIPQRVPDFNKTVDSSEDR